MDREGERGAGPAVSSAEAEGRARKSATGSADSSMGLGMRRRWRRRYRANEAALAAVTAAATRTASLAAAARNAGSGISATERLSRPLRGFIFLMRIFIIFSAGNRWMDRTRSGGNQRDSLPLASWRPDTWREEVARAWRG